MELKRAIHPDTLAALSDPAGFYPATLVHVDWPTGALRAHSGVGPIVWGGHTWHGVGAFGDVDIPGEAFGLVSGRGRLALKGLPDAALAQIEGQVRNRAADIWAAVVTTSAGNVLIGEPFGVFFGYVDAARFRVRPAGGDLINVVQVDVLSGPSARMVASLHHSDAQQAADYPGDTAGRHLPGIEARTVRITWPE